MTRGLIVAAVIALGSVAHADDSVDYVVKDGDTCLGIAIEQVGDRTAYKKIHKLNPGLGRLPHVLTRGQLLRIPARAADDGPDAQLTGTRGDVKVRRPADATWDPAKRGMDLYRAWRVGALVASSAELTFRDQARLRMRERTIVVLYGAARRQAKVIALEAELEDGALETRLGELGKRRVVVHTPDAEARMGDGRTVVKVDGQGDSIVANHDGAPVEVRGADRTRKKRTRGVKVAAGMGSKVRKGKAPDKPRPLPAAPLWVTPPRRFAALAGGDARVVAEWAPVTGAVTYRITIESAQGEEIAAVELAAPTLTAEVPGLPVGGYQVTVAAIDAEGFESRPSSGLAVEVVAIAVKPAPDADGVLAAGTAVIAPPGMSCALDGVAGAATITCRSDDGVDFAPLTVEVGPVPVPVAPPVEVAVVDEPPPELAATARPGARTRARFELGAFAGAHAFLGGDVALDLGRPADPADRVRSGPSFGLRIGHLPRASLAVEGELAIIPTGSADSPDSALVVSWRGHVALLTHRGAIGVRLLAGFGGHALVAAPPGTGVDAQPFVDWGLALTVPLGDRTALRLDARDELGPARDGLSHGFEVGLGVSVGLGD